MEIELVIGFVLGAVIVGLIIRSIYRKSKYSDSTGGGRGPFKNR